MKDCRNYFIKVPKKEVFFWAPFFEAYQGMLSLRTPEPPKNDTAIIHMHVSPDFIKDFDRLIKRFNLKKGKKL
ncbi:hypothetical protein A2526_02355 [candidate division WOR-1 bacterium RIFOXYD2_FULL_36_8]|uniref:DUF5655 domain-containing protein n=1 Tax=candidate division WOR-1 bacterium RIFOXYB2_FULL_36_35 TaxID=1802578 RepID=A0A1F4S2S0_UNCSA|nr:MAG: hypothetical protein A2230_07565 [candidate division WOR-1 bacterium RIFOXYA2_FULL_36_21]OGC14756.1 MAG: hypothetical protein A2290_08680 [candidate division WOR-1 bacterium RIFOXYB2_FULL_36_35]OGC15460.1 MAG: hypothetical protein A2282_07740 [candidate division WOR-1 bacterium RIFOXYA12_FULL_36_13]OGC38857.1 MAG: hypothetical protein A2526_02355 [candidate division WOR-1 bacterium RIFOXYD2_FULL_36_8]